MKEESPGSERDKATDERPLRVGTLEIFFDLVFAFTLIQLTALLASRLSWLSVAQALLLFGLLWWMYEGFAWLTNSGPPALTVERLLLLVGMAGFLVIGLAIPNGFGSYSVVLGLGYLLVVLVHAVLYYRVNSNILLIAPFNIASALLVIAAGLVYEASGSFGPVGYAFWIVALAVQLGSPLLVHPRSRFELRPEHLTERHSALLIVAIGESVAAIGIGAATAASPSATFSWKLIASAVLGLAVAAALWWVAFGAGDEERTERTLAQASAERRTALALNGLFYGNIPLLLGLVALAAGILRAVTQSAGVPGPPPGSAIAVGQALTLSFGSALFLAGDGYIRLQLRTGPAAVFFAAAVAMLPTAALGALAGLNAQLVLIAAIFIAALIAESRRSKVAPLTDEGTGKQTGVDAAG